MNVVWCYGLFVLHVFSAPLGQDKLQHHLLTITWQLQQQNVSDQFICLLHCFTVFQPFFFHGGTPCNNLPYPGELGPVEALTVRLIAGSLSIALGESAVSNRKRTHKSRQTQLEHELNKTNRQLAEYGDYCSVTNGRKKKISAILYRLFGILRGVSELLFV